MEHEDAADTSVACDSCDRWSDATCDSHPSQSFLPELLYACVHP
jgi:hypothetical protein